MKGILHHIEIYVSNLNQSREFWGWLLNLLGYKIFQEWEFGFSFRLESTYIVFVQVKSKYLTHKYNRCHTGLNHLAFYGESREFIDEITMKLKEKDIPILYLDRHPFAGGQNYYAVYFEDPDRIKVEIVAD